MKTDVNKDSGVKECCVKSTILQLQCIFFHVIVNQVFLRTTVVVSKRNPLPCVLVDDSDWKEANNLKMLASVAAQMMR